MIDPPDVEVERLASTPLGSLLEEVDDVLPELRLPDGYDPDESELRWIRNRAREHAQE